jgi:predicted DNA-binding protein (UPF0251 family)
MPRPRRCRWVLAEPRAMCFKPRGVPMRALDRVVLNFDEVEALRLADCEGMYQEQAADSMKVSRPTFGRILALARGKVADALLHGKALVFETGPAVQRLVRLRCPACGFDWEIGADEELTSCPACGRAVTEPEDGGDG